jgi:hypothetical protein
LLALFKFPFPADGEKRHITIPMEDLQERSISGVGFTGEDKAAATGTPGELDEAFTISVRQCIS